MWEAFCCQVDNKVATKMFTSLMKLFRLVYRLSLLTPLLEVMARNPGAECEDTRDKAFSLLSLYSEYCRVAIRPDYSQSLKEICECILEYHIEQHTPIRASYRENVTRDLFKAVRTRLWEI